MTGRPTVELLGVSIDRVTFDAAVERAVRLATARQGSLAVTANAELVWAATRDAELRTILNRADLVVADGAGVVWASRVLGEPLPQRVAGYDLMLGLLAAAAERGYRVYLLGGRPGVALRAAAVARERYAGLRVVGTAHGYFGPEDEPAVRAAIARARPHLLFVGLGAPRQEKWLACNLPALGVGLAMGVGGSLDVLAGVRRRAPDWMIRANLEWLYRLLREPRRIGRQLALPRFALAVLAARRRRRGEDRDH